MDGDNGALSHYFRKVRTLKNITYRYTKKNKLSFTVCVGMLQIKNICYPTVKYLRTAAERFIKEFASVNSRRVYQVFLDVHFHQLVKGRAEFVNPVKFGISLFYIW